MSVSPFISTKAQKLLDTLLVVSVGRESCTTIVQFSKRTYHTEASCIVGRDNNEQPGFKIRAESGLGGCGALPVGLTKGSSPNARDGREALAFGLSR